MKTIILRYNRRYSYRTATKRRKHDKNKQKNLHQIGQKEHNRAVQLWKKRRADDIILRYSEERIEKTIYEKGK